jgi:hypothetical protein
MAEKNPAKNIDRLRAEPGAEEVIPESSFDQDEPATSYKVGTSSMTADMTPSDWPDTGKGIINTSRSDDNFATQTFQPLGSPDIYQRRWDSTPLDYSDDFTQANGTPPDPVKWTIFGTGEPFIENNYLRFNTQCGINPDYQFIGNFDVQARMYKEGVASNHLSFIIETEANKTSTSVHAVTGFGIAQLGVDTINSYLTGSTSSNQHALPTGAVWFYIRIIRTGTWIDIYLGTDGISWGAPIRSGNQHVDLTGTGVFRIRNALGNASFPCRLDDYIINSGVVQPDSPTAAYWSDWQIIKDADTLNQDTTDAIEIHATVTYDHPQMVTDIGTNTTDILTKQDIIPVSETEPVAPEENDLWIDTSS